jgi:hypothetical protein
MAKPVRKKTGPPMPTVSPSAQLARFIAKFTPQMQVLAKTVRRKMRGYFPGAVEMVYDNYNALVIGFCPNERASDVICSIAVYPRWINLFFFDGDTLPDPERLLNGTGSIVRHIKLQRADDLDRPAVRALIHEARERADPPLNAESKRRLLIRSISAKQRRRRP